jgi:RNA ligase
MMQKRLKQFVQDNPKLVTMRECGDGIFVLKYKKTVFFDNLWNEYLEECRGTIVDADFNVVSRPFTKIYNYGVEAKAPVLSDDTPVTAYRKVNGFMVAMTWYQGDILVSTTGSTDNDYIDMARELMLKHQPYADWQMELLGAEGLTLMFECCHRNDPHIVVENEGLYFLGARENAWDSKVKMYGKDMADWARDYALSHLKCGYSEAVHVTMAELKEMSAQVQHEGFVFYTEDGVSAKIKSPYYLTSKWVARNPRTDKLLTKEFKEQIDEEYYGLLTHIRENIDAYTLLSEQDRLAFVRKYFE